MKIRIGERGEVEFPVFTAGNFEDHEEAFNRILEHQNASPGLPVGKTLAAYLDVAFAVLKDKLLGLTREEMRSALKGAPDVILLVKAVTEAFGLPKGEAHAGEAQGPSAST